MLYSLLVAIALPFSLAWMSYNPLVQTFLARMVGSYLSEQTNTVIKIDGLYITPRLNLHVSGVLALDQSEDTLFAAEDIFVDMRNFQLKKDKKIFVLNYLSVSNASFALIKGRNDSVFSYDYLRDHFATDTMPNTIDTTKNATDWQVSLRDLDLENVRFRYVDENRGPRPVGMDYKNLDIFVHELMIEDLTILNDTFHLEIIKLCCYDRCGFVVDELSGSFKLSPMFLIADSLKVITPRSKLDLDLEFHYNGWPSYIRFIDEVDMTAYIRPSEFNLKDAGYFAPSILVMDNDLRIGGGVKGTVNNMRVKDFRFSFGRNTRFKGDVRLYGLPNVKETYIHTSIEEFVIAQSDISRFALPGSVKFIPVPEEIKPLGAIKINGSFTGFYNDFVSTAVFNTDIGRITTDVFLRQNEDHTDVVYDGKLKATDFNIGKFLKLSKYVGELDLDGTVKGSGISENTININMLGTIDSLEFMGNTFNQVDVSGDIANNKFNGHLKVEDEILQMIFDGILDFEPEKPIFNFKADIVDADLFSLNMIDRDSLLKLSLKLNCNFIGYELDDLEGKIYIDSLEYTEGNKSWQMDHLALISLKDTGYYRRVMFTSDFLDADIKGSFTYGELPYAIDELISKEMPNFSFMPEPKKEFRTQQLDFAFQIKETADLIDIFVPGLILDDETTFSGSFNSATPLLKTSALFPEVSYMGIRGVTMKLVANANDDKILVDLNSKQLLIKESDKEDTLRLGLDKFAFGMDIDHDSLFFRLGWDDPGPQNYNKADIKGYYTNIDSLGNIFHFSKADVTINDSSWSIDKQNRIVFRPDYYGFENLVFKGGMQRLGIHGIISENPYDTLLINFTDWQLSNFDILYANYNFDLNGMTKGFIGLNNLYKTPNFFSDLQIHELEMNENLIGNADINAKWDLERKAVDIVADIIYEGNVGSSKVFDIQGSYYPEKEHDNLDFTLDLNNLRLEPFGRFVEEFVSNIDGVASAGFTVKGSLKDPQVLGKLKLMRTECRVNYLNTPYSLAHTIDFTPGQILIKDMVIYDTVGKTAIVNGNISHDKLKDFNLNISVKPTDFVCLNTNRYQNKTFYGSAVASGEVKFHGPQNDFHIDADVVTSDGSNLTIPLNNSITVTDNDFIVFINNTKDDDIAAVDKDYNVNLKGLSLDFNIEVNNTAEVMIFLPGNMGNISSKGFGDIRFTVDPRGDFKIYGDYNFLRGTFFFSLQGLLNRRFEIVQGGKISFSGNPYNADVNLKALYKLKTSLTGLGASIGPEYEGQRVNVNAFLGLRGKLANPDIHFSIGFPNVKSDVKQAIYAILDTNDTPLMNQQMLSLLLMSSFSYASSSGNMSSSSLNIISSQLSNWLSQISSDFDIGINYIPGDEINQDEVEVALSTQFFNNRLIVDGNVGVMTKDNTQQQASNIVGDVNIEYKLTPDGRIRLRAFNRANNLNSIDYYSPYTQGVGVFYTKDFDRFRDIFRRQRNKRDGSDKLEND